MSDNQAELAPIGERSAEKILELLGRRFRPEVIQQRKIGGRQVAYIPVSAVIERLNKACNTWTFRVVSRERETMVLNRWSQETRKSEPRDVSVSVAVGEMEIPELGIRQAIGVQALDDGSGEDLLKGAASDSLKKCASLFGVSVEGADYGTPAPQAAPPSVRELPQPQDSNTAPAQTTFTNDAEDRERANSRAHGVASGLFGDNGHQVLHIMAEISGKQSLTECRTGDLDELAVRLEHMPPETLSKWFDQWIAPRMPAATGEQQ